jgi:hypothetical protein
VKTCPKEAGKKSHSLFVFFSFVCIAISLCYIIFRQLKSTVPEDMTEVAFQVVVKGEKGIAVPNAKLFAITQHKEIYLGQTDRYGDFKGSKLLPRGKSFTLQALGDTYRLRKEVNLPFSAKFKSIVFLDPLEAQLGNMQLVSAHIEKMSRKIGRKSNSEKNLKVIESVGKNVSEIEVQTKNLERLAHTPTSPFVPKLSVYSNSHKLTEYLTSEILKLKIIENESQVASIDWSILKNKMRKKYNSANKNMTVIRGFSTSGEQVSGMLLPENIDAKDFPSIAKILMKIEKTAKIGSISVKGKTKFLESVYVNSIWQSEKSLPRYKKIEVHLPESLADKLNEQNQSETTYQISLVTKKGRVVRQTAKLTQNPSSSKEKIATVRAPEDNIIRAKRF